MPEIATIGIIPAFVAGIISFLSPCVLPLVPGYVSYVAGGSLEDLTENASRAKRLRALILSGWFVLGPASSPVWRERNLVTHAVTAYRNGERAATGTGANVLGDPLVALTWLVNELRVYADGVAAGQFVTTGTCVIPVPIAPGDRIRADFGELGSVEVQLT